MAFDTRYRPLRYEDVLGQEGTIKVLRQFVATGSGFRQSYLFAGPFGSGKTTLARILARALLCQGPSEGDPCDKCPSCLTFLGDSTPDGFMEVDAATNSGKADVKRILEEIEYSTFAGGRRIYLMDEAHQLSRDALDALLKPMEDSRPGTEDKRLICLFCTTEPEKMRATVLSRCAPAFVVQPNTPEEIAKRLAWVCDQEGVKYDPEVLPVIAAVTECHVRDALKAIEGISMLGVIDKETTFSYLHLDRHDEFFEILQALGRDEQGVLRRCTTLTRTMSPSMCYEKLVEVALLAYRVKFAGERPPSYWNPARLESLAALHGQNLLGLASYLARRPGRPTTAMMLCDLAQLHRMCQAQQPIQVGAAAPVIWAVGPAQQAPAAATTTARPEAAPAAPPSRIPSAQMVPGTSRVSGDGTYLEPRAIKYHQPKSPSTQPTPQTSTPATEYQAAEFVRHLAQRLWELGQGYQ